MFLFWSGVRPAADTWKSWNIQMLERTAASTDDKITKLTAVARATSNDVQFMLLHCCSLGGKERDSSGV